MTRETGTGRPTEAPPPVTREEIVDRLVRHRTLGTAPREELLWIATHGTYLVLQPGEIVADAAQVVHRLWILFSGRVTISINRGPGQRRVLEWTGGDVTGVLPYSRLGTPPGNAVVEEAIEAVVIERHDLPTLARNCYEVTAILVHLMLDRVREFTSFDLRDEKLLSLGKLAAGLAHELNNPASAALRNAKLMNGLLAAAEEAARSLCRARLTDAQLAELDRIYDLCVNGRLDRRMTGLAIADREEEIAEWLEAHGADSNTAEELAKTPLQIETLDRLSDMLETRSLDVVLSWVAAGCASRAMASDIERAAQRIHALVTAAKGFTHLDRDPSEGPVDVLAGLRDTVALLEGKARSKSVAIELNAAQDIPAAKGQSAEINQVWMNLIDNAIDAAPEHGYVTVTASFESSDVVVRVCDAGPGIPSEIKSRIFDPFFTTKSVGKGTGLGLDIVRRIVDWHKGRIDVTSEPGRTEFCIRLPALKQD